MTTNPDEIRADIERTRSELSRDVDTLGERVTPSGMARYQGDKLRGSLSRLRERVMGTAHDAGSSTRSTVSDLGDKAHGLGDRAQDLAGSAGDAVGRAPQAVLDKTEGNPLAAGLVAFGIGLVAASLIPASQTESQAAQRVKDAAQPLVDGAKDLAGTMADDLREPAQQKLQDLKQSVTGQQ